MDEFKQDENMPDIPQDEIIEKPNTGGIENQLTTLINKEVVRNLITTMRNLEYNMHHTSLPPGFKRVRVEKLIVPSSFDKHVTDICRILNVRPSTFYQGLMMEALEIYTTKMQQITLDIEFTGEVLKSVDPDAMNELLMNKLKEETEKLNKLVAEGKYDDKLSPSENLAKFYGSGEKNGEA